MKYNANEKSGQYLPDQIVLLGDSIFDNAPYVASGDSVCEQLQEKFNNTSSFNSLTPQVELLAVDGNVMANIPSQILRAQPKGNYSQRYAFLSCAGNDLLGYNASGLLSAQADTVSGALETIYKVREHFRKSYKTMLNAAQQQFESLTICTVYDAVPNLSNAERVALGIFNEVILHEASERKLPVIDLRTLCIQAEDYAEVSPIEPSKQGAEKIAQAIFDQYTHYINYNNRGISE